MTRKNEINAQKKGLIHALVAITLGGVFLLLATIMLAGLNDNASLHSAAGRVVEPRHRAATLLPVVDHTDVTPHQRELSDRILRLLPDGCRDNLKNFYVLYSKENTNRGLGGADTIIVTGNVDDQEFMALVTHECGHVVDLGELVGVERKVPSSFKDGNTVIWNDDPSVAFYRLSWVSSSTRKESSQDADFVSGYAKSDAFEDFAETFAYYALQRKEFARIAKKNPVLAAKYAFMRDVVFADIKLPVTGNHIRSKSIPWDVTKLPYSWHAKK